MKNIQLLFSALFLVLSISAYAQPDAQRAYEDSLKQADLKRRSSLALEYQAKLDIVSKYNATIDAAIQKKLLVVHRLNLNANSKAIAGQGKYNRSASFYFQNKKGVVSLKKIIILSRFGKRQDYQEFLFNENEQLYKLFHLTEMSKPESGKAFYYENEQMSLYTKDGGQVFGAEDVSSFDEDAFKESVDWLNTAAGYMALFKLMKSVEPASN